MGKMTRTGGGPHAMSSTGGPTTTTTGGVRMTNSLVKPRAGSTRTQEAGEAMPSMVKGLPGMSHCHDRLYNLEGPGSTESPAPPLLQRGMIMRFLALRETVMMDLVMKRIPIA
jgi:hypothetical protein